MAPGETRDLRLIRKSAGLTEILQRRRTMQGQGLPADQDRATGEKPRDERDNPIGQSATAVDPINDPAADGDPPPYDGPPGGGSSQGSK